MEREIDNFISYLHNIKKTSNNTELSYKRDLGKVRQYLEENGITEVNEITEEVLNSYIMYSKTILPPQLYQEMLHPLKHSFIICARKESWRKMFQKV